MQRSTLIFCLNGDQVLLGMKKRGFGVGKWNGFGGKVMEGEDPKSAALRELLEESELIVDEKDAQHVATLDFYFAEKPMFECFVYLTSIYKNEPAETEEMRPQWFSRGSLPFDDMWADDKYWLLRVLGGEKMKAKVVLDGEGKSVVEFVVEPL